MTLDVPTVKLKGMPAATPAPAALQIFSVPGGAAMFVYVTIVVPVPTTTLTERLPSFNDPATIRPVGLTVMPPSGTIVPALIASATDTVVPCRYVPTVTQLPPVAAGPAVTVNG